MGSILIDRWLGEQERVHILDEASIAIAREWVRREGRALGLPEVVTGAVVNVASELGYNQLAHARGGHICVRAVRRGDVPGLEVVAADDGPGIARPTEVLRGHGPGGGGRRPGASLGIGLAAVVELSDETDFDVRLGEGTCVWARKFAAPAPRRRQVGAYGRACVNEATTGDDGLFARGDETLLVAVADGLGHGAPARQASTRAIDVLAQAGGAPLDRALLQCHAALAGTRGAVVSAVRIDEPGGGAEVACVGNVSVHVYGIGASRRFSGPSFVLGAAGRTPRVTLEPMPLGARDVVAVFSDGLSTRTDIEGELDLLLREHPVAIAHQLVERFGRANDDALVLVVR